MLNNIILNGRFVADPEMRTTSNDVSVTSFTLACDRDYKNSGERECDFIDCVAWRNSAEFICRHFIKGQPATVCGRLQERKWVADDGSKRRKMEILVNNIYFASEKKNNDREKQNSEAAPVPEAEAIPEIDISDTDILF